MTETILKYSYNSELEEYEVIGYDSISDDGNLIIPDTYHGKPVVKIAEKAFQYCNNIKYLVIPNSIRYIGDNVLVGCTSLETITIPFMGQEKNNNSKSFIGWYFGATSYYDNDNYVPNYLKTVIITGGTKINACAFKYCINIKKVQLPNSITEIEMEAFADSGLQDINIPDLVIQIGERAFAYSHITDIVIPNGVETIENSAFAGCRNLTRATIPNSVTSIGNNAFFDCPALKEFIFTNNTSSYWDEIILQSIFSSDVTIDFKYFEPINLNLNNFPYGASNNSTLTYAGDGDTDFTGFTFDGLHSWHDLNLLRVSNDRYLDELSPEKMDLTAENPGGNGQYYFGSRHKSKKFSIEIAFDSLDEKQLRRLKQLCASEAISDLIFDENPYKVYTAKITGMPLLKYICFNENDKRIYKGEGNIEFTCYWPYAHTPTPNTKISKKLITSGLFSRDGKEFKNYVNLNKKDWKESSGLKDSFVQGSNYGDLPAPFILRDDSIVNSETKYRVGDCEITVGDSDHTYYGIEWDSKTGLVKAKKLNSDTAAYEPIFFSGTSIGGIPVGESLTWGKWDSNTGSYKTDNIQLEYDFWYY